MNGVIEILMKREGFTKEEAAEELNIAREKLVEAAAAEDFELAEDIMYGELGLEMDFLFDVLGF